MEIKYKNNYPKRFYVDEFIKGASLDQLVKYEELLLAGKLKEANDVINEYMKTKKFYKPETVINGLIKALDEEQYEIWESFDEKQTKEYIEYLEKSGLKEDLDDFKDYLASKKGKTR